MTRRIAKSFFHPITLLLFSGGLVAVVVARHSMDGDALVAFLGTTAIIVSGGVGSTRLYCSGFAEAAAPPQSIDPPPAKEDEPEQMVEEAEPEPEAEEAPTTPLGAFHDQLRDPGESVCEPFVQGVMNLEQWHYQHAGFKHLRGKDSKALEDALNEVFDQGLKLAELARKCELARLDPKNHPGSPILPSRKMEPFRDTLPPLDALLDASIADMRKKVDIAAIFEEGRELIAVLPDQMRTMHKALLKFLDGAKIGFTMPKRDRTSEQPDSAPPTGPES